MTLMLSYFEGIELLGIMKKKVAFDGLNLFDANPLSGFCTCMVHHRYTEKKI